MAQCCGAIFMPTRERKLFLFYCWLTVPGGVREFLLYWWLEPLVRKLLQVTRK